MTTVVASCEFVVVFWFLGFDNEGEPFENWYRGVVVELLSEKWGRGKINWNEVWLGKDDNCGTIQRLGISKWNPEKCTEGACRHYIKD